MIIFHSPDIEESLSLPPEESGHCVRVLRHKEGDPITVADGKGYEYRCRIVAANPKHVELTIDEKIAVVKPWKGSVTIGIAPTKNNERMEWVVEKMVENGVDNIIPVICDRSERKILKTERLEKIIISAMKQSLKFIKPSLSIPVSFDEFLHRYQNINQKFIAYCDDASGKSYLCKLMAPGTDTVILIGPEGDFSSKEIKDALNTGFKPVSLGECRLRTETAALTALNTFHIIQQIN